MIKIICTIVKNIKMVTQVRIKKEDNLYGYQFLDENDNVVLWKDMTLIERKFVIDSMTQGVEMFSKFFNK